MTDYNKKYHANVARRVEKIDANMKQFPKPLQVVGKIGSALGSIVNPAEAEDNAYRLARAAKKQWPRMR